MKKIVFLFCLLAVAFCAQAQSSSLVVRTGNKYIVDSRTYNKKEFCRYIDGRDMQAYQKFKSGMRVANAGWALFGSGIGLEFVGFGVMVGSAVQAGADIATKQDLSNIKGVLIGELITCIGTAVDLSGIVCLGVGYGRMHKAADLYNVSVYNHFRAELRPATTGLGLALAW